MCYSFAYFGKYMGHKSTFNYFSLRSWHKLKDLTYQYLLPLSALCSCYLNIYRPHGRRRWKLDADEPRKAKGNCGKPSWKSFQSVFSLLIRVIIQYLQSVISLLLWAILILFSSIISTFMKTITLKYIFHLFAQG